VAESIPSSAKFPLAVVDLDRSYPEYHHLFPECQKYWSTLKYAYFNSGASANEARQRSTMGKKNW